jgi:hypothetical protein
MSMEARLIRVAILATCLGSLGAGYRTENFIVSASSQQLAQQVAETAESLRQSLAIEWLGHELAPWEDKCPITVTAGRHLGAGGMTRFMFQHGQPFGWTMSVQGSQERILDSVLPHEITHTVFATHFGRPLPRWADEGASTTVEHPVETSKQHRLLLQFLTTNRGIAFNKMFAMTEYPHDILPLYAQGYSLARFLIAQGGKRKFVDYVGDGMKWNSWTKATQKHYGFRSLSELQVTWLEWVRQGSRPIPGNNTLSLTTTTRDRGSILVTSQSSPSKSRSSETRDVVAASYEAPASGWYERIRDGGKQASSDSDLPSTSASSRLQDRTPQSDQAVSRQQPPISARQVVLEWGSPSPASRPLAPKSPAPKQTSPSNRPTTNPGSTRTGSTYLVSPRELRDTILR